jgi:hypothetical protein
VGDRFLADLILTLHLCFILFVLFGGLLCLYRTAIAWVHLPAASWGIWIEWSGRVCPLTPLENHFRQAASEQGLSGGFVEHYLIPVLYPHYLDTPLQWLLGATVIFVNLLVYLVVILIFRKRNRPVDE